MNKHWTRTMVAVLPLMGALLPLTAMNPHWTRALAAGVGSFLGSDAVAAQAGDGHLALRQVSLGRISAKDGNGAVSLKLETGGDIPMDGKAGAFGYAALSDGPNNVLVLVTHLPIDDSSHEDPDSGFHAHVLDLMNPTAACIGATFEVDVENSKKNAAFDAAYPWTVKGSSIEVRNVPAADLGDPGIEGFAAFRLKPVLGADGKPAHLCVSVVDQI